MQKFSPKNVELFIVFIFISVNSFAKSIEKEIIQDSLLFFDENIYQKITANQLEGKFKLKYTNKLENRKWAYTRGVGLAFFPNTYLYSTGYLNFNPKTSKVGLSSISSIPSLPDVSFGSNYFKINGSKLTIIYNKISNYGKFNIVSLNNSWLILEDIRTKQRWAFNKKRNRKTNIKH
jgi:hypothetical protein